MQDLTEQNMSLLGNITAIDIGRAMDISQYQGEDLETLVQSVIETDENDAGTGSSDEAVMALQTDIVLAMQSANKNAPRFVIPYDLQDIPEGNFSHINHLAYIPKEHDQTGGSPEHCGNCWVWADTSALQLDLAYQKNITDRLSVQYFNSNYHNGTGIWACCGGNPFWFADFYNTTHHAIPWNNTNASFADGRNMCEQGESTAIPATSIGMYPSYPIDHIGARMISTNGLYEEQDISNESAISAIKAALHANKGVIILYTPDNWDPFMDFWSNQTRESVFTPYQNPNATGNDGGHVMLIIGYDDRNPDTRYWTVLNSWGAPENRPDSLFRLDMDLNYSAENPDWVHSYDFYVLDVAWK